MKKQELLKIMDENLMEKLFGFCYARTGDSQEARELCSDIVFELVNAANTEGDIKNLYGFLWRIARNTYYDFANKKRRNSDIMYQGDPEEIFPLLAHEDGEENGEDDSEALLDAVYCQIAFLTKAYREVAVLSGRTVHGRDCRPAEYQRHRHPAETVRGQEKDSKRGGRDERNQSQTSHS